MYVFLIVETIWFTADSAHKHSLETLMLRDPDSGGQTRGMSIFPIAETKTSWLFVLGLFSQASLQSIRYTSSSKHTMTHSRNTRVWETVGNAQRVCFKHSNALTVTWALWHQSDAMLHLSALTVRDTEHQSSLIMTTHTSVIMNWATEGGKSHRLHRTSEPRRKLITALPVTSTDSVCLAWCSLCYHAQESF